MGFVEASPLGWRASTPLESREDVLEALTSLSLAKPVWISPVEPISEQPSTTSTPICFEVLPRALGNDMSLLSLGGFGLSALSLKA